MSEFHETYINAIIAEQFGAKEVGDPQIPIEKEGWYWADKWDNARYTDYHGPFSSRQEAIDAGKAKRTAFVLGMNVD
jgi:hypothetical protein